jgi:hypothetical protein
MKPGQGMGTFGLLYLAGSSRQIVKNVQSKSNNPPDAPQPFKKAPQSAPKRRINL